MNKLTFDDALVSAGRTFCRAPKGLEPGVVRLAADDEKREAELFIYGDIGGFWEDSTSADEFARDLSQLDVDTINVRLNSPGGIVFDGVAIYNSLARHSAKVIVHIDGIAASIASVIAMAGDEIRISEGAHVMVHKPWSFAIGDANDMRKEADILDDLESGIVDIYEARTGADRDDLETWVEQETWFKGQAAVDAGFADTLVDAKKKSARVARSAMIPGFRNTPKDLLDGRADAPQVREFERLLRDGEGMPCAQAKRIAAIASRTLKTVQQSAAPVTQPTLRDEGGVTADDLEKLAAYIRKPFS